MTFQIVNKILAFKQENRSLLEQTLDYLSTVLVKHLLIVQKEFANQFKSELASLLLADEI